MAPHFWATFSVVKAMHLVRKKLIFVDFFTNASGHPVATNVFAIIPVLENERRR
jgi:hypothetical protein